MKETTVKIGRQEYIAPEVASVEMLGTQSVCATSLPLENQDFNFGDTPYTW